MGTEVTNLTTDEESDSVAVAATNGVSNQISDPPPKSSAVDDTGEARRNLWGPRIFKPREPKEVKESKDSDIKECTVTSPVEVPPIHRGKEVPCVINQNQDAQSPKKVSNPDAEQPINNEQSNSPTKSAAKPANVKTTAPHHTVSHPLPHTTEKSVSAGNHPSADCAENRNKFAKTNTIQLSDLPSAGNQPSADCAENRNKPAKANTIQLSDLPKKDKKSPPHTTKKSLHSENTIQTDEEDASGGNQPSVNCTENQNKPSKANVIQSTDLPKKAKKSPPHTTKKSLHSENMIQTDEEDASGGNQPSVNCTENRNKPLKTNVIQSTDLPKKAKKSPPHTTKKPLHSDNVIHTDEEEAASLNAMPVKYPKGQTIVASAPVFKSSERAEKRKEFYAKLEQKLQTLETEKMQSEARLKEENEAALKQLRKNLVFKATPMPSFYQEGPPPKVEHKKTPPTRAKSPKLGRRKSLNDASDGDNHNAICRRLTRRSLDSNKVVKKLQNVPKIRNAASKDKEIHKSSNETSEPSLDHAEVIEDRATSFSS